MKTLACKDMGMDCPYVAEGPTEDAVLENMKEHHISVHGMSEADVSPAVMDRARQHIRDK